MGKVKRIEWSKLGVEWRFRGLNGSAGDGLALWSGDRGFSAEPAGIRSTQVRTRTGQATLFNAGAIKTLADLFATVGMW